MIIKILGTGCFSCQKLEENIKKAISELELDDVEIIHIKDLDEIISYGIISTPAIMINKEIKGSGKVFEVEEIKEWLNI